jgi:hypothetical protein
VPRLQRDVRLGRHQYVSARVPESVAPRDDNDAGGVGQGKVKRRVRFPAHMGGVIPWTASLPIIEPHCLKAGRGTRPIPMERRRRVRQ